MGSIKRGTFKEFYVMRRRITCCNIKVGHTLQSKEKSFQTLLRKTVVVGPAAATRLSRSRPTFSDTKVHRLCQKHMKSLRCFARVFASTFLHTVESLLATPLSSFYVLLIPYTFLQNSERSLWDFAKNARALEIHFDGKWKMLHTT